MAGTVTINYLAVVGAAVLSMVIGSLWYGPIFGKMWLGLMGFGPEKMEEMKKKNMSKLYACALVGSLATAYVLAHFVSVWGAVDISGAFQLAFWIWLGFVATVMLSSVLWEGKSWKLYCLNAAYQLVTLFGMALVLVYWK